MTGNEIKKKDRKMVKEREGKSRTEKIVEENKNEERRGTERKMKGMRKQRE